MKIIAISLHTLTEAIRSKILVLVALISFFLILLIPLLPSFDLGVRKALFENVGFGLAYVTALAATIVLSVVQVPREIQGRTIFNTLSKPISRWQFIIGKLIGIILTVSIMLAIFFAEIFLFSLFYFYSPDWAIFAVLLTYIAEMSVIASISILLSIKLSPLVNGSLTLLITFALYSKSAFLLKGAQTSQLPIKQIDLALYYLLPNLENFNLSDKVAHGVTVQPLILVGIVLYGFAFAAVFASLACLLFFRKDIG